MSIQTSFKEKRRLITSFKPTLAQINIILLNNQFKQNNLSELSTLLLTFRKAC